MKKILATATFLSIMLPGPVSAATYNSSVRYDSGEWIISWDVQPSSCDAIALSSTGGVSATVDGSVYDVILRRYSSVDPYKPTITLINIPYGGMFSVLVNGNSYFDCGGDTYLLPGYVSPATIPTLTEWAMIVLGVVLAGGGALTTLRRRRLA